MGKVSKFRKPRADVLSPLDVAAASLPEAAAWLAADESSAARAKDEAAKGRGGGKPATSAKERREAKLQASIQRELARAEPKPRRKAGSTLRPGALGSLLDALPDADAEKVAHQPGFGARQLNNASARAAAILQFEAISMSNALRSNPIHALQAHICASLGASAPTNSTAGDAALAPSKAAIGRVAAAGSV